MSEFTHQHIGASGRTVRVRAFGNDANEIELAALDQARQFFGGDVALEIVSDYAASGASLHPDSDGKRYVAEILVRSLNR